MSARRPLVLTADAGLLDDVLGAAAAVGVAVDVAVDPGACRPLWNLAPLVVVGDDLAPALSDAGVRPRSGVLLVGRGSPGNDAWAGAARVGAEDAVSLPAGEALLAERLTEAVEPAGEEKVVAVVSGCGGAGGSVTAAALALVAARQEPAWLVDLDPLGGGADVGLGIELDGGVRWAGLGVTSGRISTRALRDAVPSVDGVAVVACDGGGQDDPAPPAVRAVLAAAKREGGTVVVDLPRHVTPARDEALTTADEVVVVLPAEVRAVLAARQVLRRFGPVTPALRALVRKVDGGVPPRDVAGSLGLALGGELEHEPAVRAAALRGRPAAMVRGTALADVCRHLLDTVAPHRGTP